MHKKIGKRITAIILAVTMLPLGDYGNVVTAEERVTNETEIVTQENKKEPGDLKISSDYTLSSDMEVNNLIQSSGVINLNGHVLKVHGNYEGTGGNIKFNGGSMYCHGDMSVGECQRILMDNANDYLYAGGSISIRTNDYYTGDITNGIIETAGDIIITSERFRPSGYNKIILSGNGRQVINTSSRGALNIVELKNTSEEGVYTSLPVNCTKLIRNNSILKISDMEGDYGYTLEEDTVIDREYVLLADTLDLNGHVLTVKGDFIQAGGRVDLNGGKLNIEGDYRIQSRTEESGETVYGMSAGILEMTDADDCVMVAGDFITSSACNAKDTLTEGILDVKGDFTINTEYSQYNFAPTGNHKVVLSGSEKQTVSFGSYYSGTVSLADLDITNSSAEGVIMAAKPCVTGNVNDNGHKVTGYIVPTNTTTFTNHTYHGDLYLYSVWNISEDCTVHGNIYSAARVNISGNLNVNGTYEEQYGSVYMKGGSLKVSGDFRASAASGYYNAVSMTNSTDYILVNGDFIMESPCRSDGLTKGTLEVKGDFHADNFYAVQEHRVLLSGNDIQKVSLSDNSCFAIFELANHSAEGVYCEKAVVKSRLVRNGCRLRYGDMEGEFGWTLSADDTYEGTLVLLDETLDLNGHTLTVKGDFIQPAGEVRLGGGTLIIEGDYRMQTRSESAGEYTYGNSAGILNMTNADDKVSIRGSYINASIANQTDYMRSGILEIGQNFEVKSTGANNRYNFYSTGDHKVVLNGTGEQEIIWSYRDNYSSRIANLEITGNAEKKVTIEGIPYVTGRINTHHVDISGSIVPGADLVFEENYFGGSLFLRETLTVGGSLDIAGDIYNDSGKIVMNSGTLSIGGSYDMNGGSYSYGIEMSHPDDSVIVGGDFNFQPSYSSTMSDGILEVKGKFKALRGFLGCRNHKVILSGSERQTVSMGSGCTMNILELKNHSEEGIYAETLIRKDELITNGCHITYKDIDGEFGWTLSGDEEHEGNLVLVDGTLNLAGHTLTVKGDIIQAGGKINVNGGTLVIEGDYRQQTENGTLQSAAVLCMRNEKDKVIIEGDYVTSSIADHRGYLTDGLIELHGNLKVESSSYYNFCPTENHTLMLKGDAAQKVKINISGSNYSGINNLVIDNSSDEGVAFENNPYVYKKVNDISENVKGSLSITDTTIFETGKFSGSLNVGSSVIYTGEVETAGNMTISSSLRLSGRIRVKGDCQMEPWSEIVMEEGSFIVDGNLSQSGNYSRGIRMTHDGDSVVVGGNFIYHPYYNAELSAGTLTVGGDFEAAVFYAQRTHKVILNGDGLQTLKIGNNDYFHILELKNYSKEGVYSQSTFRKDELIKNGCRISYGDGNTVSGYTLSEDYICEGDFILADDVLDLNGHTMTVRGDFIQSAGETVFHGGKLVIDGDYRLQNRSKDGESYTYSAGIGKLTMDDDADSIVVNGDFVFEPGTNENNGLTAGTIEVKGDFVQKGSYGFNGKAGMKLIFSGNDTQTVSASQPITLGEVTNNNTKELLINSVIKASEQIQDNTSVAAGTGSVWLDSVDRIAENKWSGSVTLTGNNTLAMDLYIGGILNIDGDMNLKGHALQTGGIKLTKTLELNGGSISCTGGFAVGTYGKLVMVSPEDYILSGGDFNFVSCYPHEGMLSDGILEVRGHFTQDGFRNFTATKNHTTILSRKKSTTGRAFVQSVVFNQYAGETKFHKLVLKKTEEEYQFRNELGLIADEVVYDVEDGVAPTGVTSITKTASTASSISIKYEGAYDESGIAGYEIYRNGVKVGVTSRTEYTDRGLTPDTVYTYRVYAFDSYRNIAVDSPELRECTEKDTEAPTAPANLSVTTKTGSSITIAWKSSKDNVKVTGYRVYRNNELIAEDITTKTYKDKNVEVGKAYSYSVEAYDAAGNVSVISEKLEASAAMPQITAVYPKDYQSLGAEQINLKVKFKDVGNSTGNKVKIEYLTDEGQWEMLSPTLLGQNRYNGNELYATYTWDISSIKEDREYNIKYTLYDAEGNQDVKKVTYRIDRKAPTLPENITAVDKNGTILLEWEPSVSADCKYYHIYRAEEKDGEFVLLDTLEDRYASSYTDKNVEEQKEYFYAITVADEFGNTSEYTEYIKGVPEKDSEVPSVTKITPDAGKINGHTVIDVTAEDNKAVKEIAIFYKAEDAKEYTELVTLEAKSGKVSYTWDTAKLPDGVYTVNAVATDAAGNKSDKEFIRRYEVDNTGIEKINVSSVSSNATYVQIKWEDVADDDLSHFQIEQLEGTEYKKVDTVKNVLGYNVTGLSPDSEYVFRVIGYDALGNRGIPSDDIKVMTTADDESPGIKSVYPAPSDYKDILHLQVCAKDNNGIDYAVFSYSCDREHFEEIAKVYAQNHRTEENLTYDFDIKEIPEGSLYIKFETYDMAGNKNALMSSGEDIIAEYKIDRTAPSAPENLEVTDECGSINIAWNAGIEEDVKSYKIYRADMNTGIYKEIASEYSAVTYCDIEVLPGKSYTYKVSACDKAGNESACSKEIAATVSEDTEAPNIRSMSPANGDVIGKDTVIKVLAIDNMAGTTVTIEYRKSGTMGGWTPIGTNTSEETSSLFSGKWDTTGLEDGKYEFRARSEDAAGNESDTFEVEYTLDSKAPEIPVYSVKSDYKKLVLSIEKGKAEDFDHFNIYRRNENGTYSKKAITTEKVYCDNDVVPGQMYYYKVTAVDRYGNESDGTEISGYVYGDSDSDNEKKPYVDTEPPVALATPTIIGMAGMEIVLDGSRSTDNVRVESFSWDMGNGDTCSGMQAVYTYQQPGIYTATLTVADGAGNTDTTTIAVQILEKDGNGIAGINVTDESGKGIPFADVYIKNSENAIVSLKADAYGRVEYTGAVGLYSAAAYAEGYVPAEGNVTIAEYKVMNYKLTLKKNDFIIGNLTARRMSLEEIVQAGIDLNDPGNINSFEFDFICEMEQTPIPVMEKHKGGTASASTYEYIPEPTSGGSGVELNPVGGGGGSRVQVTQVTPDQPILAVVKTSQDINWLKEMYSVNLQIFNAADSGFYITNAQASLNVPEGMSVVNGTAKRDMEDIRGQQQRDTDWILRGDKIGDYMITAEFSGTLMPFDRKVETKFKCEQSVTVNRGKGVRLTIMPEMSGYIGENYYIQFEIENTSSYPMYNFITSIPAFNTELPKYYVIDSETGEKKEVTGNPDVQITDPDQTTYTLISSGGDHLLFPVLKPGSKYRGTFRIAFMADGDPDKVYYKLRKYLMDILKGEDLGIEVIIKPIDGHIQVERTEEEKKTPEDTGDPIDLSSGSFMDEKELLAITGGTTISFDMSYDSRITESGELGTGWRHGYEQHIEENNGTIKYYTTPYAYAYFVRKDALDGNVYGKKAGNTIIAGEGESSTVEYACLNSALKDYKIIREEDGTYTVYAANGNSSVFDSSGRLSLIRDNTGKTVSIAYTEAGKIITDGISGKSLEIICNDSGKITSVRSGERMIQFAYNGSHLVSMTDAEGNITTYGYDEQGRIINETNAMNVTYVTNVYDEQGRVTRQTNATGDTMQIAYEDSENGTKVTVTDENNVKKYVYVNSSEKITKVVNENGGTTEYGYDADGNLVCELDSYQNQILREYDRNGNLTRYTDTGNLTTIMTYDEHHNLTSITNAEGNTARYTYDGRNLKTSETDYAGKRTLYTYDENGLPATETIEGLGSKTYTYTHGMKTAETDYNGNTTWYEYDAAGNVTKVTDALGNVTTFEYDRNGRKIKETDATGGVRSYTFDCNGNMATSTDAKGSTTYYEYDGNGHLMAERYPDGTSMTRTYDKVGNKTGEREPDGTETRYDYDESGNLIRENYADGSGVNYTYDLLNQRLTETDSSGNTIRYEYYPNGNISRETCTDAKGKTLNEKIYTYNNAWKVITITENGNATTCTYDAMGNVTSRSDALGNTITCQYDIYGRLTGETDAMGHTTTYGYDRNGNCIQKTNALNQSVYMEYDALNRLTDIYSIADGTEYRISYGYDAKGQVISTTDEEGNETRITYDLQGNILSMRDAMGNEVQNNTYDAMGRLTKSTDAMGNATAYSYDKAGRLTETIQYLNTEFQRKYSYTYDGLGRATGVTDPLEGKTACTYDNAGNISSATDANGGKTTYTYDGAGRVLSEKNAIGCRTEYTYNAERLLAQKTDAEDRNTAYTYDKAGRLTAMEDSLGTVKYTYDKNGNLLKVTDKNGTIERKYDALNRVTEYKDARGFQITYRYDAMGNLAEETYPDGSTVTYGYYKNGYLRTVTDGENRTTAYSYNGNGKVTEIRMPDGTVENDSYDVAGRLIRQTVKRKEEKLAEYTYTYDAAGNLTKSTGTGRGDAGELSSTEMTYDSQNRLLTYNGETIRYDRCGNMTYGPVNGKMTELTYDCRNRLVKAGGVTYTYDAENNRTTAETEEYKEEYITDTVSSSLSRVIMTIRSDRETTVLTYGNGLISEKTGQETLYHHYNNIGSTTMLTDHTGAIKAEYTYGTYGELLSGDRELSRYLYNGMYGVSTDANGLYYMRQRYYNTEIKRFINQDIVSGNMENSQSLNRYSYVQGNPVTLTDPFGLSPENGGNAFTSFVHGILDLAGCVPGGVGVAANLANAALYAIVDHDYGMAALSLLAGVTMGATKIVSMGGKLAKAAKTVETVGKMISNTATFAMCAVQTVKTGSAMWQKYHEKGAEFNGETAMELLTIGLNAAGMVMSGKGMVESGNKLCKTVKESGVTHKIAGKVKQTATAIKNDNRGIVDFDAPVLGRKSGSGSKLRNTKNIRYSQKSINSCFEDFTSINDLVYHLKNSPEYASKIEPIRLVKYNDLPSEVQQYLSKQGVSSSTVFTLDNRRLYAAKQAGVKVNSIWATQEDLNSIDLVRRFTTVTGGKSIELR